MDKKYLQDKLADMRQKYIGSTQEKDLGAAFSDKKMQKMKKKLVSLEMERCHKQMERMDCSKVQEKFEAQKQLFQEYCKRGS